MVGEHQLRLGFSIWGELCPTNMIALTLTAEFLLVSRRGLMSTADRLRSAGAPLAPY
jgi:hypothetical protein